MLTQKQLAPICAPCAGVLPVSAGENDTDPAIVICAHRRRVKPPCQQGVQCQLPSAVGVGLRLEAGIPVTRLGVRGSQASWGRYFSRPTPNYRLARFARCTRGLERSGRYVSLGLTGSQPLGVIYGTAVCNPKPLLDVRSYL